MSKLLLLLWACLCSYTALAQGIAFESLSWQQALTQAHTQGKWVFVDGYTTWCGPCKSMSARAFPDSAVGAFFRAHFVSVKVDMEAGEGPMLAERYQVSLYPTLLFVSPDGVLAHKAVGYHSPRQLLDVARVATDTTTNLRAYQSRYERGEHSAALLLALARAYSQAYDQRMHQVAQEYFATQSDLNSSENQDAIMEFADDPYSLAFKHFLQNIAQFEARYGTERVAQKQDAVFEAYLEEHPKMQLGEVQRLYVACYPRQGARLASSYRLTYYQQREQWDDFAQAAQEHVQFYASHSPEELNEIALLFAQHISAPARLEQAYGWAQQSVSLQEEAEPLHTLALLAHKLGKKKIALKAVRRALELVDQQAEEAIAMRELLKSLDK